MRLGRASERSVVRLHATWRSDLPSGSAVPVDRGQGKAPFGARVSVWLVNPGIHAADDEEWLALLAGPRSLP